MRSQQSNGDGIAPPSPCSSAQPRDVRRPRRERPALRRSGRCGRRGTSSSSASRGRRREPSGRWSTGVAHVLSTTHRAPTPCAQLRERGDVDHAEQRIGRRLDPEHLRVRAHAAARPHPGRSCRRRRPRAPTGRTARAAGAACRSTRLPGARTWSPGASAWKIACVAARPERIRDRRGAALERRSARSSALPVRVRRARVDVAPTIAADRRSRSKVVLRWIGGGDRARGRIGRSVRRGRRASRCACGEREGAGRAGELGKILPRSARHRQARAYDYAIFLEEPPLHSDEAVRDLISLARTAGGARRRSRDAARTGSGRGKWPRRTATSAEAFGRSRPRRRSASPISCRGSTCSPTTR